MAGVPESYLYKASKPIDFENKQVTDKIFWTLKVDSITNTVISIKLLSITVDYFYY